MVSQDPVPGPPPVHWGDGAAGRRLWPRIAALLEGRERVLIGIAGAPGAGKSTVAQAVADEAQRHLPGQVALVPMDGYHLAQTTIERRGRAGSKGAPDTFDAPGYLALLERLRRADGETVYAPEFRRELDDPVAAAVEVDPAVRVVVTEGNYLLLDTPPWSAVRPLLDEAWYVEVPETTRLERLIARHVRFKDDPATARRRALGSDQRNAELVEASRARADLVIVYA
jgi:pantothenate kinase